MTVPASRWGVCLLVAAAAAWVMLNYTPVQFDTPEELLSVDIYSPPELQTAAAEKSVELYWKNSLTKLGLVGLCLGAVALLAAASADLRRRWVPVVLGLVSGVACGLLTVVLGTFLRRYFDSDVPLPMVDESTRLLVTDMGVYMLTSVMLVLPISLAVLVWGGKQRGQKAVSILLAGVVTGFVVPVTVSVVSHTAQTNVFPPTGLVLTTIWLAVLAVLVFAFTTLTGTRRSKAKPGSQVGAA